MVRKSLCIVLRFVQVNLHGIGCFLLVDWSIARRDCVKVNAGQGFGYRFSVIDNHNGTTTFISTPIYTPPFSFQMLMSHRNEIILEL